MKDWVQLPPATSHNLVTPPSLPPSEPYPNQSRARADILQLADGLRPILLQARFDWWRRSGVSGQAGEVVARSRDLPMPAFDRTDRSILAAERSYREALETARTALDRARAIELTWLTEIHIATKEEAAQASDFGVDCECCTRPIACTPADPRRHGFCTACDKDWERKGRPDRVRFIKERRIRLDMPEAVEA